MAGRKSTTNHLEIIGEEWRPVVGFEGVYAVSSVGRVRREGRARSTYPGRALTPNLARTGYLTVALRGRTTLVHRLVAEAFLEPDERRPHVNHKNGNRVDNRIENLEFATHSENMSHAICILGRKMRGKLGVETVRAIREWHARGGVTYKEIGERYGVHPTHIRKAITREHYRDVE